MKQFIVQSYFYNEASLALRKTIAELLDTVWPNKNSPSSGQKEMAFSHRAEFSAQSFCCYSNDILVGYAAIVHKEIVHCGQHFMIGGLSCVATHPACRGRGIGSKVVSAATQYLATHNTIDLGIFTCHPNLAPFYKKAADWDINQKAILLGNLDVGSLSSISLGVVVLMKFFSEKAIQNKNLFSQGLINLDFPKGEFL